MGQDRTPKRRRLPAAERAEKLKDQAAELFAERGFAVSTRDLAARCGVTQALLYKYFGSKAELIEAVLEQRFLAGRSPPDTTSLTGPGSAVDRIAGFYGGFVTRGSDIDVRLFLRAALDRLDLPSRYGAGLDSGIFKPVLDALGSELDPPIEVSLPLTPDLRELAMTLHGSSVFTIIRRRIYGTQFHLDHADLIRRQVQMWVPGAQAELLRLVKQTD